MAFEAVLHFIAFGLNCAGHAFGSWSRIVFDFATFSFDSQKWLCHRLGQKVRAQLPLRWMRPF
jgi:hypothetical protein